MLAAVPAFTAPSRYDLESWVAQAEELGEEMERLRVALETYGSHLEECDARERPCSCGFAAAPGWPSATPDKGETDG